MVKLHISRAAPVNSVKFELGGPGGAGGGNTEAGGEAEVQLAESVLSQDAEDKNQIRDSYGISKLPLI